MSRTRKQPRNTATKATFRCLDGTKCHPDSACLFRLTEASFSAHPSTPSAPAPHYLALNARVQHRRTSVHRAYFRRSRVVRAVRRRLSVASSKPGSTPRATCGNWNTNTPRSSTAVRHARPGTRWPIPLGWQPQCLGPNAGGHRPTQGSPRALPPAQTAPVSAQAPEPAQPRSPDGDSSAARPVAVPATRNRVGRPRDDGTWWPRAEAPVASADRRVRAGGGRWRPASGPVGWSASGLPSPTRPAGWGYSGRASGLPAGAQSRSAPVPRRAEAGSPELESMRPCFGL